MSRHVKVKKVELALMRAHFKERGQRLIRRIFISRDCLTFLSSRPGCGIADLRVYAADPLGIERRAKDLLEAGGPHWADDHFCLNAGQFIVLPDSDDDEVYLRMRFF